MDNLLTRTWRAEEIEEILLRHPQKPLLPPLRSEAWKQAAANPIVKEWMRPFRAKSEAECAEPLPILTDELYSSFSLTGIRVTFERVYLERRRRLARAAISLLLSGESDAWHERLTASVIDKLELIFDESSWALPAHVNWDKDDSSGKDPLQIDLFCAETANLMAEMLDLVGEIIPPALQERIRGRLRRDVFENYLGRVFHWMEVTHNWNAVCHQGVIGAALSQVKEPELLSALLMRARKYLPIFLSGFSADGGCSEGPGYWSYGFGWFTVLNEQLETRTGGELSLFEGDEHVREIARFGPRMALSKGNLVNFSDNGATGGLSPALLSYLAERLDDTGIGAASCEQYRRVVERGIDGNSGRCDVFYLVRLILRSPAELLPSESSTIEDCFLPDLAVLVARSRDQLGHLWEFGAKGGNNNEHHNHNDCGSYILNMDGARLITEIGAPEYVHAYFDPAKRYEFLAARSLGHSVPLVNGCEQMAGAEFAASVLTCEMNSKRVKFEIDLTRCYPSEAGCRRLVRRFMWDKPAGSLRVDDLFELEMEGVVESVLMFELPGEVRNGSLFIETASGVVEIAPLSGTKLHGRETCAYRAHEGSDATVDRLRFCPAQSLLSGTVSYEIRLARPGI